MIRSNDLAAQQKLTYLSIMVEESVQPPMSPPPSRFGGFMPERPQVFRAFFMAFRFSVALAALCAFRSALRL
jgi:hypothetical protein